MYYMDVHRMAVWIYAKTLVLKDSTLVTAHVSHKECSKEPIAILLRKHVLIVLGTWHRIHVIAPVA